MAETQQVRGRKVVFLRDFIDIDQPVKAVKDRLCSDEGWLLSIARQASEESRALYVGLCPPSSRPEHPVPVRVLLGRSTPAGTGCLVALRWEAIGLTGYVPVLDGNLELSPLDAEHCRLVLSASYRPPLGAFGDWVGDPALQRMAESLVRSFISLLACCCEEGPTPESPTPRTFHDPAPEDEVRARTQEAQPSGPPSAHRSARCPLFQLGGT
jgi:hypothetical protein